MDSVAVPLMNVTLVYQGRHYEQPKTVRTIYVTMYQINNLLLQFYRVEILAFLSRGAFLKINCHLFLEMRSRDKLMVFLSTRHVGPI